MTIKNRCQKMLDDGCDLEEVLLYIKRKGFSKVESIKFIAELNKLDLNNAKKIIHFSKVWKEVRQRDEKFHDELDEDL